MINSNDCLAMLLAGGQGSRLAPLTSRFAKPVVPFGDRLRMIDFPLSNCMNSNIRNVGVLTQYCSDSVHDHIADGQAWLQSSMTRHSGEITLLPASRISSNGYAGTADAIYRNIDYIDQHNPEHILVLSGDHIYQMDYRPMLEFHKQNNANATIAVKSVPWREASRFGIMNTDKQNRVTEFQEKPANPQSNLASMGIYLFRWEALKQLLIEDAANEHSSHDFGQDILPAMLAAGSKLVAYSYEGYWKDVGTIESLWDAHMELIDGEFELDVNHWPLHTNVRTSTPIPERYNPKDAIITHSIVHPECIVEGEITRSVLCSRATVGVGSDIVESIIMPGARIGRNVTIHKAIIGEGAVIQDGAIIGELGRDEVHVVAPGETVKAYTGYSELEPLTTLISAGRERYHGSVLNY